MKYFGLLLTPFLLSLSACDSGDAQASADKARQLALEGDYENALNEINTAIRLEPDSATYYINRVFYSLKTRRYKQVIQDANTMYALDKNKKWVHVHFFKAVAEAELELYSDALSDINFYLENYKDRGVIKGELANGYVNKGAILYGLKEYKKAKESYEYAIKINNGEEESIEPRSLTGLANMIEEPEKALALVNKAIEMDNEYGLAYGIRSEILVRLGKTREAYADLGKALSLDPQNAKLNHNMAVLLNDHMHLSSEAELYYAKAREFSPR